MSTFKWNAKSIINPELATQCIQDSPNNLLQVETIEFFGQGFDNVAFLVNGKYVFRFPRNQEAEQLLSDENKVLPKIQNMFSLSIPNPIFFGKPTDQYPFHFHGYEILQGLPAYRVDLSDDKLKACLKSLAQFLKRLHSIKAVQAQAMGACSQVYDRTKVDTVIESMRSKIQKLEAKNIVTFDYDFINQLIEQAKTVIINHDDNCLVHGDLDYRHMLIDNRQLAGIIDWGDVGINHPVVDFMGINLMFEKSMHEIFFKHYGKVSDDIWSYARFISLHRAITLMLYAHDIKDTKMFDVAKKSYERLKGLQN